VAASFALVPHRLSMSLILASKQHVSQPLHCTGATNNTPSTDFLWSSSSRLCARLLRGVIDKTELVACDLTAAAGAAAAGDSTVFFFFVLTLRTLRTVVVVVDDDGVVGVEEEEGGASSEEEEEEEEDEEETV
jgi:hypothetical protein